MQDHCRLDELSIFQYLHILRDLVFLFSLRTPTKVTPFSGLLRHIDFWQKLSALVIVRAAPTAYTIVAETISVVEVYIFCDYVEPNIYVFPEENRRCHCLLLNLYSIGTIFNSIIFAPAYRLRFPNSIECEYLLTTVQTIYYSCNWSCFEHRTAPAHHSCRWSYIFADIIEVLIVIFGYLKNCIRMVIPKTLSILYCAWKL